MKTFAKVMVKTDKAFMQLASKFPTLSLDKIKKDNFLSSQTHEHFRDSEFDSALDGNEKATLKSFKLVSIRFLGGKK